MAKNRARNKKKVAQNKQERMINHIEEKVEEHNPWKDLRNEILNQGAKNSEYDPLAQDGSRLKSKKYERSLTGTHSDKDLSYDRNESVKNTAGSEGLQTQGRKYMYDSARTPDEDEPVVTEEPKEKEIAVSGTQDGENEPEREKGEGLFSAIIRLFKGTPRKPLPEESYEYEESAETKGVESPETKSVKSPETKSEESPETSKSAAAKGNKDSKESSGKRRFSKTVRRLIGTAAILLAICAVVLGFFGFKFMVKYGSLKYLYNYLHDTKGSLRYETDELALEGADEDVPHAVDETDPKEYRVKEKVDSVWGEEVDRLLPIQFNTEKNADAAISGFFTFRGNYRRDASSVGAVTANEKTFERSWEYTTGKLLKNNGSDYWSGNGWTGQPLLAQWDDEVRQTMNMYDSAKAKNGLVEVIYPGMDGKIHFLDIDTGEETRPVINVGMTFKGTASIYPDGTPLLFCGCGDAQTGPFGENVSQRFYIYSLIDGKLLYEGGIEDSFAPRRWHAYDSSPIIDPETDTLIYPGENGVIYTMTLNTEYNKEYGTISVNPSDLVKYTFTIEGTYAENKRVWGSECSACAWNGYIFLGDNAGMFYCLAHHC